MTFLLKLRHWELLLMLALPTIMSLMFKIPFGPLVSASIGLFMLVVLFAWIFSIGAWSNRHLVHRAPVEIAAGKRRFGLHDIQQYLFPAIYFSHRDLADSTRGKPALSQTGAI